MTICERFITILTLLHYSCRRARTFQVGVLIEECVLTEGVLWCVHKISKIYSQGITVVLLSYAIIMNDNLHYNEAKVSTRYLL